jgi:hypothetical protein
MRRKSAPRIGKPAPYPIPRARCSQAGTTLSLVAFWNDW